MKLFLRLILVAISGWAVCANAQTLTKGEQVAYNKLQAGDSILLANGAGISNASLPEIDLDNVFLSSEDSRNANYWSGVYTMGVLAGLSEDNIFVLVDAPKQKSYTSYYLQHAKTKKYVKCTIGFEGDVYNQGKAELTENMDDATSFFALNAKAQGANTTFCNDNSVLLGHYEGTKQVWFGPFANYSFIYYGTVDKNPWNIFRPKWIMPVTKQSVQLTTSKAVGEEMTLTITSPDEVSVDWGDGEFVPYTAGEVKGQVKGGNIVVNGTGHLTGLDCSGQSITALDASAATRLLTLQCANNQLTMLSLSENTELQELDCADNQLTKLSLDNVTLTYLDCSRNNLTTLAVVKLTALQHLICTANNINSLSLSKNTKLKTLWCQDNKLKSLNLGSCPELNSLCASRNTLSSITMASNVSMTDVWVDSNLLSKLNLGSSAPTTLNCAHNQMTQLIMKEPSASYKPYLIDQSDNKFLMKDFYPSKYITYYFLQPQEMIELPFTQVAVNEFIDFGDYFRNSANTRGTIVFYDAATDEPLVKGSASTCDYYVKANEVKFWYDRPATYFKATHTLYPGLEFVSSTFIVGTGNGISDAQEAVDAGSAILYDLQGRRVDQASKGIYIVNGKKVVIK